MSQIKTKFLQFNYEIPCMQMIYTREHTKVKPTYKIMRGFVKGREVRGRGWVGMNLHSDRRT